MYKHLKLVMTGLVRDFFRYILRSRRIWHMGRFLDILAVNNYEP
jgi:hypothetical protein